MKGKLLGGDKRVRGLPLPPGGRIVLLRLLRRCKAHRETRRMPSREECGSSGEGAPTRWERSSASIWAAYLRLRGSVDSDA